MINYKIKVKGLKSRPGTISLTALKTIIDVVLDGSSKVLRLASEGESTKKGRAPTWLSKCTEFTVTGIYEGSTTVEIEAPTLQEALPEEIQKKDEWYTVPNPQDTAISLLARSVKDTISEQLESENYDIGVLNAILSADPLISDYATEIELVSEERTEDNFRLGSLELEKIRNLKKNSPEPKAIIVSGLLNTIEHSTKRFKLLLKDGEVIQGTIDPSNITDEDMRNFWGKHVTIKGTMHFKFSGRPRLIEAEMIKISEIGEEIFETIPHQISLPEVLEDIKKTQNREQLLNTIWGQWPGDESIEDILSALKHRSGENR